jgi:hypothetical protein
MGSIDLQNDKPRLQKSVSSSHDDETQSRSRFNGPEWPAKELGTLSGRGWLLRLLFAFHPLAFLLRRDFVSDLARDLALELSKREQHIESKSTMEVVVLNC